MVSRKISGGTRSERGSETKSILASLFGTWRLQERNPYQALQSILSNHPLQTLSRPTLNNYSEGFHRINGSFVENIEQSSRKRPPEDIDVVTFYFRDGNANAEYQNLFNPHITKANFDVDGYGVELGKPLYIATVIEIGYFHAMWSHRRVAHVWKGFLQVDLDPTEDRSARRRLHVIRDREEKR